MISSWGEAAKQPAKTAALIEAHRGGHRLSRQRLARVAYAEQLNQLTVVDKAGKRQHIAYGNDGEQGKIFQAVGRHLGGTAREEDADAWSVMKVPLFALTVTGVIGGFLIWFTTTADRDAEIAGRSAGMQNLINWLGYPVGTTWLSILVGTLALFIFSCMVYLLVKRPKQQVFDF